MIDKRIRELVTESMVSQAEFAKRVGVAPNTLSNWVRGYITPNEASLARIARKCGVTQEWLRGETDDRESTAEWEYDDHGTYREVR